MPEVWVSRWWIVTVSAISGRRPATYFPMVSVNDSLPRSTSWAMATAVNILFNDAMQNLVSVVLAAPRFRSAMP
jgi:hypothetical protein